MSAVMLAAFQAYIKDVKGGAFPGREHTYTIPKEEWEALSRLLRRGATACRGRARRLSWGVL